MIADVIRRVVAREPVGADDMQVAFSAVMDGAASGAQVAALLVALRMKGETAQELTGAARAMRERVVPIRTLRDGLVDTCGTGGDGSGTFNVSTVAALVAAAAGVNVAKHGNRAVSSACGSADVLEQLGVAIDLDAGETAGVLDEVGIAFLFAPALHPGMAAVAGIRRELGVRTMFNLLGPLANPAGARRQVMGVYRRELVPVMAEVLAATGGQHVLVVHGDDGLDEISVSAPTTLCEVRDGTRRAYRITPADLGLREWPLEQVRGGDAAANARIARDVLDGAPGAAHDIVLANAGAAIHVGGRTASLREAVGLARDAIASGAAAAKLGALVAASRRRRELRP